jgi:tyrosine-protein kinase Etk/Wzc
VSVGQTGASTIILRLAKYRLYIFFVPFVFGVFTMIYSMMLPPVFTAYARLLPPQTNTATATSLLNQIGGTAILGASALTLKNPSDLYASLFYSRTVQDDVIEKFDLGKHYKEPDIDSLRVLVGKRTKADVGRDGIITISYTDINSKTSADIANSMIAAMYRLARTLAKAESERKLEFYDRLIDGEKSKLAAATAELLEIERITGLTRLKGQEEASSGALVELQGMIASKEIELRKMAIIGKPSHPEIIRGKEELRALKAQVRALETPQYRPQTDPNNKEYTGKVMLLPFKSYAELRARVEPMRRAADISSGVLEQLIKAKALSQVDESRDFSIISILDDAVPPTRKSGPRVLMNTIVGVLIGFFLTVFFVLFWEVLFTDKDRRERWGNVANSFFPTEKISNLTSSVLKKLKKLLR